MGETDEAGSTAVMERKRRSGTRTSSQKELDGEDKALEPGAAKREKPSGSVIQYHDVTAAAYRIRNGVKETPLKVSVSVDLYNKQIQL